MKKTYFAIMVAVSLITVTPSFAMEEVDLRVSKLTQKCYKYDNKLLECLNDELMRREGTSRSLLQFHYYDDKEKPAWDTVDNPEIREKWENLWKKSVTIRKDFEEKSSAIANEHLKKFHNLWEKYKKLYPLVPLHRQSVKLEHVEVNRRADQMCIPKEPVEEYYMAYEDLKEDVERDFYGIKESTIPAEAKAEYNVIWDQMRDFVRSLDAQK